MMEYVYLFFAVILSVSLHEFAHGYVSYKLGDPTPLEEGRLTLNPLKHLDPFGALCMFVFHIGWAKPVMINPGYYEKPKRGIALVGLAGPGMNLITACMGIFIMSFMQAMATRGSLPVNELVIGIYTFFSYFCMLSIYQAVFNLIPLPPLDGSKIIAYFLPDAVMAFYSRYDRYCMFLLMALLYFNVIDLPLNAIYQFIESNIWNLADALFSGLHTVTM